MPAVGSLERVLRLFMALCTLLLLTVTVLQTEDRDGYQATHLFFMPRDNWEMDFGRGMLFDEDHYREVDLEVLREEVFGFDAAEEAPAIEAYGESDAPEDQLLAQASQGGPRHGSFLRRTPSVPSAAGNSLPVAQLSDISPTDHPVEQALGADLVCAYEPWFGEIPSPPPRASSSL